MKRNKFLALCVMLTILFSCFGKVEPAKADLPFVIRSTAISVYDVVPGETTHLVIPVQLGSYNYWIGYGSVVMVNVTTESGLFETTQGYLNYTGDGTRPEQPATLNPSSITYVEFDLQINDTAKIGTYTANLEFAFHGYQYGETETIPVTEATVPFNIRVLRELAPAQLSVDRLTYEESEATIGGAFEIGFDVVNGGEMKAYNTYVTIDYGNSGIVPDYTMESVRVGDIGPGAVSHQNFPVRVLAGTEPGVKTITAYFKYKDIAGTEHEASRTVYINLQAPVASPKEDAKLTAQAVLLNAEVEGNTAYDLEILLENVGVKTASNIRVLIAENGGIGAATGILPNYPMEGVKVQEIAPGEKTTVTLPLVLTKSAAAGLQEFVVQVDYEDSEGRALTTGTKAYMTIVIPEKTEEEVTNELVISKVVQSPEQPVAGEILTLTFEVSNHGSNDITDLVLYGEEFSNSSFEPLTAEGKHTVGTLAKGATKQVTMQFRLGTQIPEGMNPLKLAAAYVDANGNPQKEETTLYVLKVTQVSTEQVKNSIAISNISQSPESPVVGEKVTVSFTVTNNGTKEIQDLKFKGVNLGSTNFEPVSSEIYTVAGDIAAGAAKKVSMTFRVGEDIPEGFNTLSLEYTYVDGKQDIQTESAAFYVLDVKNASAVNTSRPKLIVADFATSTEELRAGSTFDFTFALKNTHTSKAAKNIKVTVLQPEGIFSITTGSNSFYIDEIAPGEVSENTLNMKVKSDTATGAYEISIQVEYEYDDMSQTDAAAGGVLDENKIRLQAVENARPAVQNLMVGYAWDTPMVNQATTLTFDFYNMGKSTLDNVYITLSGDYMLEMGNMQIIGSVMAGSSSYQEVSIVPLMEGMCNGILTVHFEDSNGDEVTKEFELPETYVQGDYSGGGAWEIPEDDWYMPVEGDEMIEPKKPLMPWWAYITALVAALCIGTLLARTIVIRHAKKKLLGEEDI
ncbi:MAG: hypothetical protein IJY09_02195 [Lachnospiraceae bacterium]|nr:hypothetical protein [Lachnospiraceae bacterium]